MVRYSPLIAVAVLLQPCLARIATLPVVERGVSAVLIADEFGMAAGGYINFDVAIDEESGNNSRWNGGTAYIVVVGESTTKQWFSTLIEMGNLEADDPPPVCVAPSTGRFEVTAPGSFNMSIVQHDLYSAYLVVCHRGGSFTGDVTTTFINLDPEGGLTQHLPIEAAMLPALYLLISVVYVGLAGAWVGEMIRLHTHVLPVHYLCLICVAVKMVETILVAAYYYRQNKEGQNQDGLRVVATLAVSFFRVMFLLTLLLFSLGWGFIRQSLRSKEGWLVSITVGFYAGISLLDAGCEESSTNWCSGISLVEYAIRSLIMLSTVVAINFNITHIRFCIQLPWTSSSALEYLKLSRYLSYRVTFLAYLLLPTALLVVKITILSWEYNWIYSALEEFVMMLILIRLGTTFAPLDPWLLTRAFDHSLEQER